MPRKPAQLPNPKSKRPGTFSGPPVKRAQRTDKLVERSMVVKRPNGKLAHLTVTANPVVNEPVAAGKYQPKWAFGPADGMGGPVAGVRLTEGYLTQKYPNPLDALKAAEDAARKAIRKADGRP